MGDHEAESPTPMFSSDLYDKIKWVAQYFLPGAGALYFALAAIWGFPYAEEVIGTITAIDIFLGLLLGISSKQYDKSDAKYDGKVVVYPGEDKDLYSLEVDVPLSELSDKKDLTFKVTDGDIAP